MRCVASLFCQWFHQIFSEDRRAEDTNNKKIRKRIIENGMLLNVNRHLTLRRGNACSWSSQNVNYIDQRVLEGAETSICRHLFTLLRYWIKHDDADAKWCWQILSNVSDGNPKIVEIHYVLGDKTLSRQGKKIQIGFSIIKPPSWALTSKHRQLSLI